MYKNQALYVYVQTAESGGAVRALFFCLELNDATGYYVLQYHSLSVPCLCFVHSGLGLGLTLSDRVVAPVTVQYSSSRYVSNLLIVIV